MTDPAPANGSRPRALPTVGGSADARQRILVVDDSRAQRMMLAATLQASGYEVIQAADGSAALDIVRAEPVDFVISDWMMPGLDGLELCSALREYQPEPYIYFILLTSKSEKADLTQGLEIGADDFITKPVSAEELRARITAGLRQLDIQRQLNEKNRLLGASLEEIQRLYSVIDNDLREARKLQDALVRDRFARFEHAQVSLLQRASGHVGGDLVGYVPGPNHKLGLFGIDVSGHGIASAMMTARLAGHLTSGVPEHNLALERRPDGSEAMRSPADVARRFNALLNDTIDTEQYFTLVYAVIDLATGQGTLVQAGHPHPALQARDGSTRYLGEGGLPIGLIPDADFDEVTFTLKPGERLLLCSDGMTECPDPEGVLLEEHGLARILQTNRALTGPSLLEALVWELAAFHGDDSFPDDLSAVLFEFEG